MLTDARRAVEKVGATFAAAATDQTVLAKPSSGRLALTLVVAHAPSGLTSPTITLKDGTQLLGTWPVPAGDSKTLLAAPNGLRLTSNLVAQASAVGVVVSAWGAEVE
jgi:hypothetical protein